MDEEFDRINVVPLVDVMLVLLTIVLTTATFIVTGQIPVDLAEAHHVTTTRPTPLVLTLTLHRAVYVNGQPAPNLAAALQGIARDTPLIVRADGGLPLRDFVELVDKVKGLGFGQVSLEVRRT